MHARARADDASRVSKEPLLDESGGRGFIETGAAAWSFKTGHAVSKAGCLLPMVALSYGVSGVPWGAAWLSLRKKAGLAAEVDMCFQPDILRDGAFGVARMRTKDVAELLKRLLKKAGVDEYVSQYGAHSAKATVLSWAAKYGLSVEDRRFLGGHADPSAKSVLEYSRDTLAAPVRNVDGAVQGYPP